MVSADGIEPSTFSLEGYCSSTELRGHTGIIGFLSWEQGVFDIKIISLSGKIQIERTAPHYPIKMEAKEVYLKKNEQHIPKHQNKYTTIHIRHQAWLVLTIYIVKHSFFWQ